MSEGNGQAAAPAESPRVRFGPRDNQTVPFEWAETMLMSFAEDNPKLFGTYLQLAAGLVIKTGPGRPPGSKNETSG